MGLPRNALAASEILQDHGYEHYEISNFAKPGFRSRHNLKYWTGGEYLGFGPCAASDFAGKRFTIEPDLRVYVEGIAHHGSVLSECETIPPRERAGEYVMLRSRIASGMPPGQCPGGKQPLLKTASSHRLSVSSLHSS